MTDAPHPRRPALTPNRQALEAFGDPAATDRPREFIGGTFADLPDPPGVAIQQAQQGRPSNAGVAQAVTEETIVTVIREEMDELAVRLSRFNVAFPPAVRQQMVDTALALLSGMIRPGGVMSGR